MLRIKNKFQNLKTVAFLLDRYTDQFDIINSDPIHLDNFNYLTTSVSVMSQLMKQTGTIMNNS